MFIESGQFREVGDKQGSNLITELFTHIFKYNTHFSIFLSRVRKRKEMTVHHTRYNERKWNTCQSDIGGYNEVETIQAE